MLIMEAGSLYIHTFVVLLFQYGVHPCFFTIDNPKRSRIALKSLIQLYDWTILWRVLSLRNYFVMGLYVNELNKRRL